MRRDGIEMLANEKHLIKVWFPMVFTEEEIEILVNDEQTPKAYFSMIFTDDGIEIFTKDVHLFSGTFTDQQQKGILSNGIP